MYRLKYRLKYRRQARNYLARLPLKTKTAIVNKLHELAANPDNPDIEILKGRKGFRLRVGQYRVIYTRQDAPLILEVVKVRARGDIYKG
jgi:mRNA interferase RelE/StbE